MLPRIGIELILFVGVLVGCFALFESLLSCRWLSRLIRRAQPPAESADRIIASYDVLQAEIDRALAMSEHAVAERLQEQKRLRDLARP